MKIFTSIIIAIVAVVVVAGFIFGGTPRAARLTRLDDIRVGNLQEIQFQVLEYWRLNKTLPKMLDSIRPFISESALFDPESGEMYVYEQTDEMKFKICAYFALEQGLEGKFDKSFHPRVVEPFPLGEKGVRYILLGESWSHNAGEFCFEREIEVVDTKDTFSE
jgi:hypothetical protein